MIETFSVTLPSAGGAPAAEPFLCGVVSSGNLEVLVEGHARSGACEIHVSTSADGFRTIWEAVLQDFALRHPAGGLRISINDAGATPAVVSLRLDQAFDGYRGSR